MDQDADADRLGAIVEDIVTAGRLGEMSGAARRLGRPDAAERVAELVRGAA
jgi:UDP-N-acetylglucosamine:LPS N-acetylglucosamine transferase